MFRSFVCLCLLAIAVAAPAHAETRTRAAFTIAIAGITVGTVQLTGVETATAYSASAALDSAGAARVFRKFSYRGQAQGAAARGRFVPARYEEAADTGRRTSDAVLAYAGGVPQLMRYTAPVPADAPVVTPASQGGTLDPMSALFSVMRDQGEEGICNRRLVMFDGRRRSHAVLGAPHRVADGILCAGEYRRLDGYGAAELSRNVVFPMTVLYRPGPGGLMQVAKVELQSVYGPATVTRR